MEPVVVVREAWELERGRVVDRPDTTSPQLQNLVACFVGDVPANERRQHLQSGQLDARVLAELEHPIERVEGTGAAARQPAERRPPRFLASSILINPNHCRIMLNPELLLLTGTAGGESGQI